MSGFDPRMMSSTSASAGSAIEDANIAAQMSNVPNPYTALPLVDRSIETTRSPGGNYLPSDTPAENIAAMDREIKLAGNEAMRQQQNPNQFGALMFAGQLMDRGQQQSPQMPSFGQIRGAKQPNITDPIGALLAPKMKKKQPISLL